MGSKKIYAGSLVSWTRRYDGMLVRNTGYVTEVIANRCSVKVIRSTPLEDTGESMGDDTVYDPPIIRRVSLKELQLLE